MREEADEAEEAALERERGGFGRRGHRIGSGKRGFERGGFERE